MAGKEIALLTHSDDTELYHHGMKGMRWGVRKSKYWESPKKQSEIKRAASTAVTRNMKPGRSLKTAKGIAIAKTTAYGLGMGYVNTRMAGQVTDVVLGKTSAPIRAYGKAMAQSVVASHYLEATIRADMAIANYNQDAKKTTSK